jgi:excinuclease UvrABC nuclease subunit
MNATHAGSPHAQSQKEFLVSAREQNKVTALFEKLTSAAVHRFPKSGEKLDAPIEQGVYVIYSPREQVLHVGRTPSGRKGLRQRLGNHLHGASSFTIRYFNGQGSTLRSGYVFRYLVVKDPRQRALLEAYAIGRLCPAHLGIGLVPVLAE